MPRGPKKRSPYKPWTVVDGGLDQRRHEGHCFACARYLGTTYAWRRYVVLREAVKIAGVTFDEGEIVCPHCLERAKQKL